MITMSKRLLALTFVALTAHLALLAADKPASTPAPAAAKSAKPAKAKPGPDVLVVADVMTRDETEKAALVPTAENPIYYYLLGKKEEHIGTPFANDPMPKGEEVEAEIVKYLAKQHFIKTEVGKTKPQIIILFTWGSASLDEQQLEETDPDTGDTTITTVTTDKRRLELMAGKHKAEDKLLMSTEADVLNDNIRTDRLFIMIAAMDADALAKKEKKLLWRTNISMENRRANLTETFPAMIASAAPYFGRENGVNETIDDKMRKADGTVTYGELKVLENGTPTEEKTPAKK